MHNSINNIKNSYKKENAANNEQKKMLEEANVRESKQFLKMQAKSKNNFNHSMNNFK
jgi:hypothetical protein